MNDDDPGSAPDLGALTLPKGKRIAVSFQLTLEAWGATPRTKMALTPEFPREAQERGLEDLASKSWYDYGGRSGFPRLLRTVRELDINVSISTSALAVERWPDVAKAAVADGHELIGHGYSQDHRMFLMNREEDQAEVSRSVKTLEAITGQRPVGWSSQGSQRGDHTVDSLLTERFWYTNDFRDADVPYVVAERDGRPLIAMPRTDEINDAMLFRRYGQPPSVYVEFFKRAFDQLLAEGDRSPGVVTAIFHPTYFGRPFGVSALVECVQYARSHHEAWICRRRDVAEHYLRELGHNPAEW